MSKNTIKQIAMSNKIFILYNSQPILYNFIY